MHMNIFYADEMLFTNEQLFKKEIPSIDSSCRTACTSQFYDGLEWGNMRCKTTYFR